MVSTFSAAIGQARRMNMPAAMRAPGLLETLFYIFVTFYASKALFLLIAMGPQNLQDNQLADLDGGWLRALWAFCYLGALFFLTRNFESVYRSVKTQPALVALLGWSALSAAWSAEPLMTLQYGVIMTLCALLGVLMGTRYTTQGVVDIVVYTLALALIMSAVVIFFVPGWGKMPGIHAGAWSGIFIHKNGLGSVAVMGATLFGYRALDAKGQSRMGWIALVALAVILAIGARSATALLVLIAITIGAWLSGLVRLKAKDLWLAFFALLTAGFFCGWMLASNLEFFFKALGKDMTLTGRIEIWQWGFESLLHRPVHGYGFESFWLNKGPHGGAHIRLLVGWAAPHIHNSWLQIALDVGLVGVGCYLIFLTRIVKNCWYLAAQSGDMVYRVVLLLLLQTMIYSMVETLLYKRNSETFILMVALSVSMAREAALVRSGGRLEDEPADY